MYTPAVTATDATRRPEIARAVYLCAHRFAARRSLTLVTVARRRRRIVIATNKGKLAYVYTLLIGSNQSAGRRD